MHHPKGGAYGCPLGHPLEPGARRADERQKEKRVATYNGHPFGVPICMPPVGACINGVGALPTPYGPTLRGAHYPLPSVATKKKVMKPRLIARPWSSNYGQNQCNLCQNMRQDVAFEVEPSKIIVRVVRPRRKPAKILPKYLPPAPPPYPPPQKLGENIDAKGAITKISFFFLKNVRKCGAILKVTLPHKIYLDVGILSTFLVACNLVSSA